MHGRSKENKRVYFQSKAPTTRVASARFRALFKARNEKKDKYEADPAAGGQARVQSETRVFIAFFQACGENPRSPAGRYRDGHPDHEGLT